MKTEDAFTTLRLILSPLVMALIFSNEMVAALCLYLAAAITDIFDGYFARKRKKVSKKGGVFDALADFTLVYLTIFALAVVKEGSWLVVLMVISLALVVYVVGLISMKKGSLDIPHLTSAKVFGWFVHPTVMAYIISWKYAGIIFLMALAVGAYTAFDYIVYAQNKKIYK